MRWADVTFPILQSNVIRMRQYNYTICLCALLRFGNPWKTRYDNRPGKSARAQSFDYSNLPPSPKRQSVSVWRRPLFWPEFRKTIAVSDAPFARRNLSHVPLVLSVNLRPAKFEEFPVATDRPIRSSCANCFRLRAPRIFRKLLKCANDCFEAKIRCLSYLCVVWRKEHKIRS